MRIGMYQAAWKMPLNHHARLMETYAKKLPTLKHVNIKLEAADFERHEKPEQLAEPKAVAMTFCEKHRIITE